jgi:hypothetical protein
MNELNRDAELTPVTELAFSGQSEWWKEQRLWAFAHDLLNQSGLRPTSEDLEDFVTSHFDTMVGGAL